MAPSKYTPQKYTELLEEYRDMYRQLELYKRTEAFKNTSGYAILVLHEGNPIAVIGGWSCREANENLKREEKYFESLEHKRENITFKLIRYTAPNRWAAERGLDANWAWKHDPSGYIKREDDGE